MVEIKVGQTWSFNAEYFYKVVKVSGNKVTLRYLDPRDRFTYTTTKDKLRKDAWFVY